MFCVEPVIIIFSIALLYFLSQPKSRFENIRFQTSNLNPIKSENIASIKRTPQPSILIHILFGISAVALHLLLIMVALCTSRDVHHLALWLQIPAEGSGLEPIYTRNYSCSFALLHPCKLCSGFLPPSHISNQPYGWRGQPRQTCGGGGSGGGHAGEPAPSSYEVRSISSTHGDELF